MPAASSSTSIGPTLSDIAFMARNVIKYGAAVLIFFIVGRIILNMSVSIYKAMNPPKPPPPTFGFGTLPAIVFGDDLAKPASYTLQTVTGALPYLGDQAKVFFIPSQKANLLAVDRAKKQAAALGFVFQYEQVSSTLLRWRRQAPLPATLEIDVVSGAVTLTVDWASNPAFLAQKSLPNEQNAAILAKSLLRQANLLPEDVATGPATVTYLKAIGTTYSPAVSFSESDFVRVDLSRTPVSGRYPVVGPDINAGNVRVILSGNQDTDQQIVFISYKYHAVEYESVQTYPLIPTSTAWSMLQAGQGHVASILPAGVTQAVIRGVSLGYFDPPDGQNYLQPIYIFKGDNGFIGYVPAVSSTPVKK